MSSSPKIFVHIVTYNSSSTIGTCIDRLLRLNQSEHDNELYIQVTDNASQDATLQQLSSFPLERIHVVSNANNLGFCAAHNAAIHRFMSGDWEYFLCLNPDVALDTFAVQRLVGSIEYDKRCGSACPKLLRADQRLDPINPAIIDAAGMYMAPSLRHFDRGSGKPDGPEYSSDCFVFGGSGACLLMTRAFLSSVAIPYTKHEDALDAIYPQLRNGRHERVQVFDEAFFAYREDADLAWRSQRFGWKCRYVADAVGYHVRVVTPERRKLLPAEINMWGVRNRFLMQLNHYQLGLGATVFFAGYMLRNAIVVAGCLFRERSSLTAFGQLIRLFRRAFINRAFIKKRASVDSSALRGWFRWSETGYPATNEPGGETSEERRVLGEAGSR